MKFDKYVSDAIKEHGKILTEKIRGAFPNTNSIILVGAIAKSEGGMVRHENVVSPVNDYDLYFVSDDCADSDTIKNLESVCADAIKESIRKRYGKRNVWKDFDNIVSNLKVDIRKLEKNFASFPLLRFYEMKHTAMTIFGEDVKDSLPNIKDSDLMAPDGLKLMFNEITHLIEFLDEKKISGKLNYSEKFMIDYFISKVYSAVCTSLLIKIGVVPISVVERVKKIKNIYVKQFAELNKNIPDLPKIIEENVNIRNDTKFVRRGINRKKKLEKLVSDMNAVFRFYLKDMIDCDKNDWSEMAECVGKNLWKSYYRPYIDYKLKIYPLKLFAGVLTKIASMRLNMIYTSNCRKTGFRIPDIRFPDYGTAIMSQLFLLFFSIPIKGKSGTLIRELSKYGIEAKTWDSARKQYIKIYRSYYWQKII